MTGANDEIRADPHQCHEHGGLFGHAILHSVIDSAQKDEEISTSLRRSWETSEELSGGMIASLQARWDGFKSHIATCLNGWVLLERHLEEASLSAQHKVDDALAAHIMREFVAMEAVLYEHTVLVCPCRGFCA